MSKVSATSVAWKLENGQFWLLFLQYIYIWLTVAYFVRSPLCLFDYLPVVETMYEVFRALLHEHGFSRNLSPLLLPSLLSFSTD